MASRTRRAASSCGTEPVEALTLNVCRVQELEDAAEELVACIAAGTEWKDDRSQMR